MNEPHVDVARALYRDAAIGLDALADRFADDAEIIGDCAAIIAQLQEVAAYARGELEVLRHPESRAWAVMTWCEHDPRRGTYKQALDGSRNLRERDDEDIIEITLRRYGVAVDDPFRAKLVERLREAARGL